MKGLSRSNLQRLRCQYRAKCAAEQRAALHNTDEPLTLHWDPIKVISLTNKNIEVERCPLVVTGKTTDQILGARIIAKGTGVLQAQELFARCEEWKCTERVRAACSDTTASNTGPDNGAFVKLEMALGRGIIYLACRHHLLEIVPKTIFDALVEKSASPTIGKLCETMQKVWINMDHTNFKSAMDDAVARAVLDEETVQRITLFATSTLQVRPNPNPTTSRYAPTLRL